MPPNLPEAGGELGCGLQGRPAVPATDGGHYAAALTYYLILALFPAGALIYALLGLFGAESAVGRGGGSRVRLRAGVRERAA